MYRLFIFIAIVCGILSESNAATRNVVPRNAAQATNTSSYNYNYMYPYMNNKMRTDLNPGVSPTLSSNLIDTVVRTSAASETPKRQVVPRRTTGNTARVATNSGANITTNTARRVIPRRSSTPARYGVSSVAPTAHKYVRSTRNQQSVNTSGTDLNYATQSSTARVSSARCLADYTECMNGYCERENTAYNRCYCSAKLSQLDSTYQTKIDQLIKQILQFKSANYWTDAEMNKYWMDTVGKYNGDNSWTKLDSALNINWADMESRVRGQQAFITGHDYCVQHLRACAYMADNMRDAYRSEIARDCSKYETSLQKLQNIAESVVESLQ